MFIDKFYRLNCNKPGFIRITGISAELASSSIAIKVANTVSVAFHFETHFIECSYIFTQIKGLMPQVNSKRVDMNNKQSSMHWAYKGQKHLLGKLSLY